MAGEDSAGIVPVWDEKSSSLDSFEERIRRYVKGTKKDERYLCANRILGRFNPDRLPYKTIMAKVTEDELEEKDGKGAYVIVPTLRQGLGPKTMQEATRLFRELFTLKTLTRQSGESMKMWTARFTAYIHSVGTALHAAEPDISATNFLHPVLQGIILMMASNLDPSEQAAVLATSGDPSADTESRKRNSHHVDHLVLSFCSQWSDDAITRRDGQSRRTRAQACTPGGRPLMALLRGGRGGCAEVRARVDEPAADRVGVARDGPDDDAPGLLGLLEVRQQ